jgi:hypothetical protein
LRACLNALSKDAPEAEVIVVDNASTDGSAEMVEAEFPGVRLIRNARNLGYAAANNQAMSQARGDFFLLLNPDANVLPGCMSTLAKFLESTRDAGAAAPQLLNPGGSIQASVRSFPTPGALLWDAMGFARLFPRSRTFGAYRMTWWDHSDVREVDQPMASALMLRRKALDQVGLMDESFPMFFNDVDSCYRLRQAGWKTWYVPEAKAIHHVAASTSQVRAEMILESHRSLARFYAKHYRRSMPLLLYAPCLAFMAIAGRLRLLGHYLGRKKIADSN